MTDKKDVCTECGNEMKILPGEKEYTCLYCAGTHIKNMLGKIRIEGDKIDVLDEERTCEDCYNKMELVPGKEKEKVYACRYCMGVAIAIARLSNNTVKPPCSPFPDQNGPFELPTWRGYTVDFRTRQFRKVTGKGHHGSIEFLDFDTVKGKVFLYEMVLYYSVLYDERA